MNKEIYNRRLESLKQEKQRETDRHNIEMSNIAKRRQAEIDKHNKAIQNINMRIEQAKNAKQVSSNEDYFMVSDINKTIREINKLCEKINNYIM